MDIAFIMCQFCKAHLYLISIVRFISIGKLCWHLCGRYIEPFWLCIRSNTNTVQDFIV